MDIQKQLNDRLQGYLTSEKFEEHMNKTVEDAVNKSLESLFSFGEIRDTIKQMFKERIAINLDEIDFPHVNQVVTDIVREKTVRAFTGPMREKLSAELDDMFAPAPAEITVQGIIDLLREELKEDECGCADPEISMGCEITESDYGHTVKIWKEKKSGGRYSVSEPRADIEFYVRKGNKNGERKNTIAIIYNADCGKWFGTGVYGFDAKLFMMYCQGTMITDVGEVETDYLNLRINDHIDY